MATMIRLFTLRLPGLDGDPPIHVRAYQDPSRATYGSSHQRIDVEVTQGDEIVFARGLHYGGIPAGKSPTGCRAREHVLRMIDQHPALTDRDYFKDYQPGQLQWARRYADHISAIRESRYCRRDGRLRGTE